MNIGDKVTILIDTPGDEPIEGTIKIVQKKTGKLIGVELDAWTKYAHSLDGILEEKEDAGGFTIGRGWWTRPENIEVKE